MSRLLLPLIAVLAIAYAVFSVMRTHPRRVPSDPPAPPPVSPFERTLAGVGLIESSTENIAISTPISGLVTKVLIAPDAPVKVGEALFQIDDRALRAELAVRQAALALSEAKVATAETALADAQDQSERAEALRKSKVNSDEEFARRSFAQRSAAARWREAKAEAAAASTQVQATEIELERSVVRAPLDAVVLQVKVRAGEYATAGSLAVPLVTLGRPRPFHLRVDLDEHEAWRFRVESAAVAQLRGNPQVSIPLKFVRLEPLVIPKRSLTGGATERVDTRVLQVIYEVEPGNVPLFVGQQMDVFIKDGSRSPR